MMNHMLQRHSQMRLPPQDQLHVQILDIQDTPTLTTISTGAMVDQIIATTTAMATATTILMETILMEPTMTITGRMVGQTVIVGIIAMVCSHTHTLQSNSNTRTTNPHNYPTIMSRTMHAPLPQTRFIVNKYRDYKKNNVSQALLIL